MVMKAAFPPGRQSMPRGASMPAGCPVCRHHDFPGTALRPCHRQGPPHPEPCHPAAHRRRAATCRLCRRGDQRARNHLDRDPSGTGRGRGDAGGTRQRPLHGTTPLHAIGDLPERPAVLCLNRSAICMAAGPVVSAAVSASTRFFPTLMSRGWSGQSPQPTPQRYGRLKSRPPPPLTTMA